MHLDHFGLVAPIYERVIRTPDLTRLRTVANLQATDRLLDVGGGTGRISRHLVSKVTTAWIIDLSHGMLRQAKDGGIGLCQGVAEALPYPNGAFDKIVAVDSFHHFADHKLAADELLRILRPGGRLTIEEPDIRSFVVKLVALGEKLALMHSHFRPPQELVGLFRRDNTSVHLYATDHTYWLTVDKHDLHHV
jgi:demethylmenaquinone methyltransferase/2-methoxy-6-polyprenyl-1,4-benzoquinol methylase